MKILNEISCRKNYMSFGNTSKLAFKFPDVIVTEVREKSQTIDPKNYDLNILKVINAIKESKGYRKFLERFNVDNIEIKDFEHKSEFGNLYGAEWTNYNYKYYVYMRNPRLKEEYKNSEKTLIDRIRDFLLPLKNIKYNCDFDMSYSQGKTAPNRIKHTSYLGIMYNFLKENKEQEKRAKNDEQKNKLRKELNILT